MQDDMTEGALTPRVILYTSAVGQPVIDACRMSAPGSASLAAFAPEAALRHLASGEKLFIIWHGAAETLARALAAGSAPGPALTEWSAAMQQVLAVFRRNRRRVTLLADSVFTSPGAALTELGLQVAPAGARDPAYPAHLAALADLAIARLPELAAVLAELQASSILPASQAFDFAALDQIAAGLAAQTADQARSAEAHQAALNEAGLLQEQLSLLQETMEAQTAGWDRQKAALQQRVTELEPLADTADRLRAELEQLRPLAAEAADLRQKIAERDDRLAKTEHLHSQTAARLATSENEMAHLQAQLDLLQAALDMQAAEAGRQAAAASDQDMARLLADLRREAEARVAAEVQLGRLRGQIVVQQQERNDLIAARDAMSRLTADSTGLLDTIAAQARELENLRAREAELVASLEQLHAHETELSQALSAEIAERERVFASHSWKMTEPLRTARRLLSRPRS